MHLILGLLVFGVLAWCFPRAFPWLVLGPMVGIPLGIVTWSFLQLWSPALLSVQACGLCAGAGWFVSGTFFSRYL